MLRAFRLQRNNLGPQRRVLDLEHLDPCSKGGVLGDQLGDAVLKLSESSLQRHPPSLPHLARTGADTSHSARLRNPNGYVEPQTMSHPSNGSDAPASQDVAAAAKEHTAAIAQTVSESG